MDYRKTERKELIVRIDAQLSQIVMNITMNFKFWITKISMKLTVDFAQRYSVGRKPVEVYALLRIRRFIKQKVSKTQEQGTEIFECDLLSRTKPIKIRKYNFQFQIDQIMML